MSLDLSEKYSSVSCASNWFQLIEAYSPLLQMEIEDFLRRRFF